MSATNYTPIYLYNSGTATNTPSAANLGAGELAINYADGKLFYKDSSAAVQVIGWKTTPTTAGGTGLTSYTAGDLPYYASGSALSKLGIGTANYVLTSSGSAPQYVAQSTLSVGSATNATNTAITDNTSSSATWYPTIVSATTGNLPQTTSSTKLSFVPSTGVLSITGLTLGTALSVGNGGTGLTTLTAGYIPYGNGTSPLNTVSTLKYDGTNFNAPGIYQSSTTLTALTYNTLAPTPTFDGSSCSVSVSSGNSINFGANFSGLILVSDSGYSGCNALLLCGGGGTQVISQSTTTLYFTNSSTVGDYRFYLTGGSYQLFASARSTVFKVTAFRSTAST